MVTLHKNQLLHTEQPMLKLQKRNFIDMDSLDTYSIGYNYGWKNKKLFAHLLAQRVR